MVLLDIHMRASGSFETSPLREHRAPVSVQEISAVVQHILNDQARSNIPDIEEINVIPGGICTCTPFLEPVVIKDTCVRLFGRMILINFIKSVDIVLRLDIYQKIILAPIDIYMTILLSIIMIEERKISKLGFYAHLKTVHSGEGDKDRVIERKRGQLIYS